MKVIVIGGGPSGIMASIAARTSGHEVLILEKMSSLGRKLLITGKGRCNITNAITIEEFIKNIPGNGKFLHSCFEKFTNKNIVELLEKNGLKTKIERGNRVFPVSDKSQDVLNVLINILKEQKVKVKTNTKVSNIIVQNNTVIGVKTITGEIFKADKIILSTGGKSYPATGSTGDGYDMAKELGHNIIEIKPSLVPLNIIECEICKKMQGLSLKNVKIKIMANKRNIYEDFGEMIFTHFGVSGPIILSASAILLRYKNIEQLLSNGEVKLIIDLKPALDENKIDLRILRDFEECKNKQFKNSLDKLLPQKMIPIIVEKTGINGNKPVNEITKQERKKIVEQLKNFCLTIKSLENIEAAIITAGGISTKEIDPKTMQSKLIDGLYFAGEIIDVDAYTGGFNLQIAWSTGYVAGKDNR